MSVDAWWGKRWIEDLERLSTAWQNRLPRGRDYANKGHVLTLSVASGRISARVQGSRSKPYTTTVEVQNNRETDWDRLVEKLSKEARFPAKLLAGEMPEDIDSLCRDLGLSLFPTRNSELIGQCTCPDKGRPCKHIAAVHYAFGEALDRDPFLLFQLRGADRDTLLRGFYRAWFGANAGVTIPSQSKGGMPAEGLRVQTLSADRFNRSPEPLEGLSFAFSTPEQPLLVLKRLGQPAPWQLPIGVDDLLGPVYEETANLARHIALSIDQLREQDDLLDDDFDDDEDELLDDDEDDFDDDDEEDDFDDEDTPAEEQGTTESGSYVSLPVQDLSPRETPGTRPTDDARPVRSTESGRSAPTSRGKGIPDLRLKLHASDSTADPSRSAADEAPDASAEAAVLIRRTSGERTSRRQRRRNRGGNDALTLVRPAGSEPEDSQEPLKPAGLLTRRRSSPTGAEQRLDQRAIAQGLEDRALRLLEEGHYEQATETLQESWHTQPSEERFLLLLLAAQHAGRSVEVTEAECSWIREQTGPARQAMGPIELLPLLTGGAYADAADRLERMGESAWSQRTPYARLFVPFTMIALCTEEEPMPGTALAEIWDELFQRELPAFERMDDPPAPLGAWFEWSLQDRPPGPTELARLESVMLSLIMHLQNSREATTDNEVAAEAVRYTVAAAEALSLRNQHDAQQRFLEGSLPHLRRQPRLRLALDEAVERWPILADAES